MCVYGCVKRRRGSCFSGARKVEATERRGRGQPGGNHRRKSESGCCGLARFVGSQSQQSSSSSHTEILSSYALAFVPLGQRLLRAPSSKRAQIFLAGFATKDPVGLPGGRHPGNLDAWHRRGNRSRGLTRQCPFVCRSKRVSVR